MDYYFHELRGFFFLPPPPPTSLTGDNIEELFTRIAVVAFENSLMKEIAAASQPAPSNGQISSNSTLISKDYSKVVKQLPTFTYKQQQKKDCESLSMSANRNEQYNVLKALNSKQVALFCFNWRPHTK